MDDIESIELSVDTEDEAEVDIGIVAGKALTLKEKQLRKESYLSNMVIFKSSKSLGKKKTPRARSVNRRRSVVVKRIFDESIAKILDDALHSLNWSKLNMYENHYEALAKGLIKNKTLRRISFRGSNFGLHANNSVLLAQALHSNTSLEKLDLGLTSLDDEDIKHFTNALKANNELYELDISGNNIGEVGALHIASMLAENTGLTHLMLHGNPITAKGCKEVADALKRNNSLRMLSLYDTASEEYEEYFMDALNINKSLISLELGSFDRDKVEDKLTQNKKIRFKEMLNGNRKAEWNRSRVMFVGKGRAGKTATVRSLLGKAFQETTSSTMGAEISETTGGGGMYAKSWNEVRRIRDHAAEFAARMMVTRSRFAPVNDTEPGSNKDQQEQTSIPSFQKESTSDLVGNRVRNESNSGENNVIREYDEKLLVNAKGQSHSIALSLWDFGGQEVFHSMHHIFLTNSGVYVHVFDVRALDSVEEREMALSNFDFWMRSIKLHSPNSPVVLVGTFSGDSNYKKKRDAQERVNNLIKELLETMGMDQVVNNRERKLTYFPIDNKEQIGIKSLQTAIEKEAIRDLSNLGVSIRWMVFLDNILRYKKSSKYLHMTLVRKCAEEAGIQSLNEIDVALKLFHERGMLTHLTTTENLRNIIVIQPQWLMDGLGQVIRDQNHHSFDMEKVVSVGLEKDAQRMFSKGIASRDLLEFVWQYNEIPFFVDLMKSTMLLSEWSFNGEQNFLIPSLLQTCYEGSVSGIKCNFDFSGTFLPNGLFARLICLCVENSSLHIQKGGMLPMPRLYKNYAVLDFEQGLRLRLLEEKSAHRISLILDSDKNASKALYILVSMLRKVNEDAMGTGLTWATYVQDPQNSKMIPLEEARMKMLKPWFHVKDLLGSAEKTKYLDLASFLESFSVIDLKP